MNPCGGVGGKIVPGRMTATWHKGDQVGPYTLLEPVGGGAFAEVWRAFSGQSQPTVVLKILRDAAHRDALKREVAVAQALDHENVLLSRPGSDLDAPQPYLVFPDLRAVSLEQCLVEKPATVVEEVFQRRLVRDVLAGLA